MGNVVLNSTSHRALSAVGVFGLTLGMVPVAAVATGDSAQPAAKDASSEASAAKADTKRYIVTMAKPSLSAAFKNSGSTSRLNTQTAAAQSYTQKLEAQHATAAKAVDADMVFEYSTVVNGFSADLTEKQVAALKARGDVVSVTPVRIERLLDGPAAPSVFSANKPQTDVSRDVIGLTGDNGLWNQVGGKAEAGKGQVVAVIDSGITPDNPSFSDEGMAAPPSTWNGECEAGEDPANWSADKCNNKLIGARSYVDEMMAAYPGQEFGPDESNSPYDKNQASHGSHVAGIVAGTELSNGELSIVGVAPAAHIAAYKVCMDIVQDGEVFQGCLGDASVMAYEDAVNDGADVINYSISNDDSYANDPVDEAMKGAADAGVFVAAAGGNYGPGTSNPVNVNNGLPWVTTVAAANHREADGPVPSVPDWSSVGPVVEEPGNQNLLAPSLGAPGVQVLSVYNNKQHGYMDGTSMASPHVAGMAAIVTGAKSDWSPMAVKSALQTTAKTYANDYSNDPFVGGNGFLDGTKVLNPGAVFDSGLADWDAFDGDRANGYQMNIASIQIGQLKSDGATAVTRSLTGVAEGSVTWTATYEGPETLEVTAPDVTVAAGETVETEISVANTGAAADEWQKGWITYSADGQNDIRVPVVARGPVTDGGTDPEPEPDNELLRWWGADRYGTAADIATKYGKADTVYIASGEGFSDAMTGSTAAARGETLSMPDGGEDVPVLLTRNDRIPAQTTEALQTLGAKKVVLIGGETAISGEVADQFAAAGLTVERIGGEDRYETSANVAEKFGAGLDTLYVASGEDAAYADALAGSALAGMQNVPVLLTHPTEVAKSTQDAINELKPKKVVVLGGPAAVSDAVAQQLGASERLAGANRYETAAEIAEQFGDTDWTFVADGMDFPDALTGGAYAASVDSPVLLTRTAKLPAATSAYITENTTEKTVIFGGTAAVSEGVEAELKAILGIN